GTELVLLSGLGRTLISSRSKLASDVLKVAWCNSTATRFSPCKSRPGDKANSPNVWPSSEAGSAKVDAFTGPVVVLLRAASRPVASVNQRQRAPAGTSVSIRPDEENILAAGDTAPPGKRGSVPSRVK